MRTITVRENGKTKKFRKIVKWEELENNNWRDYIAFMFFGGGYTAFVCGLSIPNKTLIFMGLGFFFIFGLLTFIKKRKVTWEQIK